MLEALANLSIIKDPNVDLEEKRVDIKYMKGLIDEN